MRRLALMISVWVRLRGRKSVLRHFGRPGPTDTLLPVSVANEIEVVVGSDGSLTVPADELARHGVGPGAHLRLVASGDSGSGRRSMRGALASITTPDAVRAWSEALDDDRAERRSRLGSLDG